MLSRDQILDGLYFCRTQMLKARQRATPDRAEMLRNSIADAVAANDRKKVKEVKQIMNSEKSKRSWSVINATVDDPRLPAVTEIGRQENGKMEWYKDEEGVTRVFREECIERYNLARKAPVMGSEISTLNEIDEADLEYALKLINGTVPVPEDLDSATREYLIELREMSKDNPRERGKKFSVTRSMFVEFWKKANEHTQSSISGHHYGFYKAASKDKFGSDAHALQLTLVGRSGVPPPRWLNTLQLLLAKGRGLCTVKNNRILNLYEADFNELKSHVVGGEAMEAMLDAKRLPEEQGSQRGSTALDVSFDGTLMIDIARQSRIPMIMGSIDAAQCYDRVLHLWLLLIWLALLQDAPLVYVILFCLQNMKFFTRTGYGDSASSYGGTHTRLNWMGLGQGSRGAPDAWLQVSSPIFNVMKKQVLWHKLKTL